VIAQREHPWVLRQELGRLQAKRSALLGRLEAAHAMANRLHVEAAQVRGELVAVDQELKRVATAAASGHQEGMTAGGRRC
jgi:hypothetical protein